MLKFLYILEPRLCVRNRFVPKNLQLEYTNISYCEVVYIYFVTNFFPSAVA